MWIRHRNLLLLWCFIF